MTALACPKCRADLRASTVVVLTCDECRAGESGDAAGVSTQALTAARDRALVALENKIASTQRYSDDEIRAAMRRINDDLAQRRAAKKEG